MESHEHVVREVRRAIMRDVLRWSLPTAGLISATTLVISILTGVFAAHWYRGLTSTVMLTFTLVSAFETWRGRVDRAVAAFIAGSLATVLLALIFNGGLRSPTLGMLLFIIALCGWAYGRRAANGMALFSLALGGLFLVLDRRLPAAPTLPAFGELWMFVVLVALVWSTSARPPERMRAALLEAAEREAELKAEQHRRLAAARQFQAVFDQTSYFMGLVSPDGILQSANRAALEFIGLSSPESVVGRPFPETPWWKNASQPLLAEHLQRAVAGHITRFETTHTDTQGNTRNIDFSLTPFRDETGQLRYVIAEGRDITEVVQQKERAHSAQRLELVGQLAGGVAHDFNNVLMVMLSSAEVLRLELEAGGLHSPEVTESIDSIIASARRASDLTRRLLSFARRGSMARRPVSVHALLESTCRLLQRTLPANIHIICALGASEDRVDGDLSALESALINLGVNARDAMPGGGTLTFSTERVDVDAAWCRQSGFEVSPGPFLRLSVRDTGSGIAPEHLPHVFEPFFTTKEEGKGTGLGLASVYGVVRDHRGAVHVESTPGRGTVFHLTLPISHTPTLASAPVNVVRRFPGVRALVVDDEPAIRAMVPRLLDTLGIESVIAANAEEAAQRFDSSFHLLVSDIVLPGRRGNELALELLDRSPSLKVVLMSGFPKDSDLSTLPANRVRLLTKPFTLDDLQQKLGELLAG